MMMRISTKGRYAMRLMLDLAMNQEKGWVRIKAVAERQDISEKYLEQIIAVLNHAGFVKSCRGPQGGYKLARPPEEYTAGMILRLTEGDLSPVACMSGADYQCDRRENCATLMLWEKLSKAIGDVVDHTTLADLLEWQEEKGNHYII